MEKNLFSPINDQESDQNDFDIDFGDLFNTC